MRIPVQEADALSPAPFRTGAWPNGQAAHTLNLGCDALQKYMALVRDKGGDRAARHSTSLVPAWLCESGQNFFRAATLLRGYWAGLFLELLWPRFSSSPSSLTRCSIAFSLSRMTRAPGNQGILRV